MSFSKAFTEGRAIAQKIIDNELAQNTAILNVFKELTTQVHTCTNNKVSITVSDDGRFIVAHGWEVIDIILALWAPNRVGFPCTITLIDGGYVCKDITVLKETLIKMLTCPIVSKLLIDMENGIVGIEPIHSEEMVASHKLKLTGK